jgi:hypothetical protein
MSRNSQRFVADPLFQPSARADSQRRAVSAHHPIWTASHALKCAASDQPGGPAAADFDSGGFRPIRNQVCFGPLQRTSMIPRSINPRTGASKLPAALAASERAVVPDRTSCRSGSIRAARRLSDGQNPRKTACRRRLFRRCRAAPLPTKPTERQPVLGYPTSNKG